MDGIFLLQKLTTKKIQLENIQNFLNYKEVPISGPLFEVF